MELIGWLGVVLGLCVAPPQLYKIIKTGKKEAISRVTYTFLCLALLCYLIYAVYIGDLVFITAQSVNLIVNSVILGYLIWG